MPTPPDRLPDDDGYRLWLRYERVPNGRLRYLARALFARVVFPAPSATLAAARDELARGWAGLLGGALRFGEGAVGQTPPTLIAGTPTSYPGLGGLGNDPALHALGAEGFALRRLPGGPLVLTANQDVGVLYGVFHLLRQLQLGRPIAEITSAPRATLRMLDHWDNLDGTIERGYAGRSLWDWHKLPGYVSSRITDYARANASLGINAVALTNVNADARVLTAEYLSKVAALADVLRPWGQRVFLTARFSAPIELGGLPTADPCDARVAAWWRAKADEIHGHIPDFGGFLVKANSEGQPGPHDFGRSHAEGANMLADALAPHGGQVIWRAFVYRAEDNEDRAKQAYRELVPLDGTFRDNVVLQVKNGPIDFQPREPFHPLFGAMPKTPLVLELQLTQEYLGFATHLAYLAPMFTEVLTADTYARGPGSTVARVVDGSLDGHRRAGFAAVTNIGNDRNWCGHPFAQANWYAFGRLAWDHTLTADAIADDWLRMTFANDDRFVAPVKAMMLASREAVVDYMTPMGLHHLMARDHHYGPGPWVDGGRRRLDVGLLPPRRRGRHRLRPHRNRQRRGVALLVAATRPAGRSRALPRDPAALVPPRSLGPPPAIGADVVERALPPLHRRRRRRRRDARDLGDGGAPHRRRARRARPRAARDPGAGGALVAQRLLALLPDLLPPRAPRRPAAARGDARRLPGPRPEPRPGDLVRHEAGHAARGKRVRDPVGGDGDRLLCSEHEVVRRDPGGERRADRSAGDGERLRQRVL